MDNSEFKSGEGHCIISEEVIASIASTAAAEVPGVAGLANRPADLRGIVYSASTVKSVRVVNSENETILDVYVNLLKGAHIQEVAKNIQHNVKMAVQSMTGRPVTRVNVHIEGLVVEENEEN